MNPIIKYCLDIYPNQSCEDCINDCEYIVNLFRCPYEWEPTLNYPGRYD